MSGAKSFRSVLLAALAVLLFMSAGVAVADDVDAAPRYNPNPLVPFEPELPRLRLPPVKLYAFCAFDTAVFADFNDWDSNEADLDVELFVKTTVHSYFFDMEYVIDPGEVDNDYWYQSLAGRGEFVYGWIKATDPDGLTYGWSRVTAC